MQELSSPVHPVSRPFWSGPRREEVCWRGEDGIDRWQIVRLADANCVGGIGRVLACGLRAMQLVMDKART